MITIQVVDFSGKPLAGARVGVSTSTGLGGGANDSGYTDHAGRVTLAGDPGQGTVTVNGYEALRGYVAASITVEGRAA